MQSHFGRDYGFLGLLAETNTETGHDFIALEKFFWHSQFLSAVKRCKMWIELFRNSNNTPSWKGHLTRNLELMSGKGGKKKSRYTVDHFRCHSLKLQIPSTRSVEMFTIRCGWSKHDLHGMYSYGDRFSIASAKLFQVEALLIKDYFSENS